MDKRNGQETVPVRDRAAEVGINLNTIFTALVLAGIVWVGTTLESIRKDLRDTFISIAVMQRDVVELKKDLDTHKQNPNAHGRIK